MGQIRNRTKYPLKVNPKPNDYFIGSDSEKNGNTINFSIASVIDTIKSTGEQNRILSGSITWVQNLQFQCSNIEYFLSGSLYTSPPTLLTLANGGALGRVDVIAVTTSSEVIVIQGTPSVTPVKPLLPNSTDYLEAITVEIAAGATVPTGAVKDLIWNENLGEPTEWTAIGTGDGVTIGYNLPAPFVPYSGTKVIRVLKSIAVNGAITFVNNTPVTFNGNDYIKIPFEKHEVFTDDILFEMQMFLGATAVSEKITITHPIFGFDNGMVNGFQDIVVPLFIFKTVPTSYDKMVISITNIPTSEVWIDGVERVSGVKIIPPFNAAGAVEGFGIAGYVPKWLNATTLTDSTIFQGGVNTGFNTNSPTTPIHVKATNPLIRLEKPAEIDWFVGNAVSDGFSIYPNADVSAFNIDSSSRTGLGTTSPTEKLEVVGNIKASGLVTASGFRIPLGTSAQFLKADGTVDSTAYAPLASPALTGNPTAPTPTLGDNDTSIATTAFVQAAFSSNIQDVIVDGVTTKAPSQNAVFDALALKANLSGATFTGAVIAPSFATPTGTAAQFLKANGTVDSNNYLTTSAAASTYVPYTGAISDVNLGEFGISQAGRIQLDLSPSTYTRAIGNIGWSDSDGTAEMMLKGGQAVLQLGQETFLRAVNKTGITTTKAAYQAVHITGAQGQRVKYDLAKADTIANATNTVGLIAEDILNNAEGFIKTGGVLPNINTTGSLQGETWADGDKLYLSATTAGAVTNIKPSTPERLNILGVVAYAHSSQGKIYVNVSKSLELDELNNVLITSPQQGDRLVYNSATSTWTNDSVPLFYNTGVQSFAGSSFPSSTTVTIGAAVGWIVDNETNPNSITKTKVVYGGAINIPVPTRTTGTASYVLLAKGVVTGGVGAGALIFQNTLPTSAQRKTAIYLCKIAHSDLTTITFVGDEPDFLLSPLQQFRDLAQVFNYVNTNVRVQPNGANLNLNLNAGSIFGDGINFTMDNTNPNTFNVAAVGTTPFKYRVQNGGTTGNVTVIDPTMYDVGGVITPVPNPAATSTNQYVFYVPAASGGGIRIQYGQNTYANLASAVGAIGKETFVTNPNFVRNAILIGVISVQKGATQLNNTTQANFFVTDIFGQLVGATAGTTTATMQSGYNNSVTPQIVTTTALGAITNRIGSAADTDTIYQVQNTAGTNTLQITGNGDINITDVNSNAGAAAVSALNIAQTWNTSGTPTAIKLNVTDTLSNAASLLLDVQKGGVSQFNVGKLATTVAATQQLQALGTLAVGTSATVGRANIVDTTLAGSGSLAASVLNLSQTWNTTGAPTAIKLNVTNTASGVGSKLFDLQVGGVSLNNVDKNGANTLKSILDGQKALDMQGMNGALFSVDDVMIGDIHSVNDISGMPLFVVNSDNRATVYGDLYVKSIAVTGFVTGTTPIYTVVSSLGLSAMFDYVATEAGGAQRSGVIRANWNTTSAVYNETASPDLGGSTAGITFTVTYSAGIVSLNSVITSGTWSIRVGARIL